MLSRLMRRSPVPRDLGAVTHVAVDREADPRALGADPAAVAALWRAVERLYESGIHPAIQLCVRRHGRVLLDRAIGYARGNGPDDAPDVPKVPVTPDTPFSIMSASKPLTAMVMHLLAERGALHLDDPVCEYLPDFARHGKADVTIRHLLLHRAGLALVDPAALDLDRLADPALVRETVCELRPNSPPGRVLAYHAVTAGFVLGEIVREVTGRDIRAFVDEAIVRPLGLRWTNYGVAPADADRVAYNYFTGPPLSLTFRLLFRRVLGVDFEALSPLSNDRRFLTGIIPSANVVTTASEISLFYQLLLEHGATGGVRVFTPKTVSRATAEQTYMEFDRTLGLPIRYSLGFMLGARWLSLYGPDTESAFGHLGFTNVVTWADPARDVSVALLTSGKPFVYPALCNLLDIALQLGLACPKVGFQEMAS